MSSIGIRVYANKNDEKRLGNASLTFAGQLAVKDIRIMNGSKGIFIGMPSEANGVGKYEPFFYADAETKNAFSREVLSVYEQAKQSAGGMAETVSEKTELPFDVSVSLDTGNEVDKAIVSLKVLDHYYIEKIKVRYKADEDRYFVLMPSYKTKSGEWKSIINPVTAEFREMLNTGIIEAYKKTLEMEQESI